MVYDFKANKFCILMIAYYMHFVLFSHMNLLTVQEEWKSASRIVNNIDKCFWLIFVDCADVR